MTREERIERWVLRVGPLVEHCETCQPYDKEDNKVFWAMGERVSMSDFLTDHRVAEELHEAVAARLSCPWCGREGFDLWDDVGLETAEEREHRKRWTEWERKYSGQLEDFGRHLEKYPYLGLSHPLGRRIRKAISSFPLTTLGTSKWWRARKPDGARLFTPADMAPPPPDKATAEGRFNHYGQVVFYLASSHEGALAETLDPSLGDGVGWVQRFSVPARTRVLSLVSPGFHDEPGVPILALGLMNQISRFRPNPGSPWKPEYFIPRFIADCSREQGISGVVFESQKHMARNLALFRWAPSKIRPLGEPRLRRHPARRSPNEVEIEFDF